MTTKRLIFASLIAGIGMSAMASDILNTDAYTWRGDTIIQGKFKAYAPDAHHIISTYEAQPQYFMPIEHEWTLKNDISMYPQLKSSSTLLNAIYNMGLDEMVNAVEPDTTLRTGKEWAGVWTRDVSYSIILSMAYLQPTASKISLMRKVTPEGRIVQDTGSGGAWPISSDRMIWAVAAYELYKVTGDEQWLEYIYPIIRDSFADDLVVLYDGDTQNLPKGETSFIDWREQSYPKWMQTADIYNSQALSTSVVHARALEILAELEKRFGTPEQAQKYSQMHDSLVKAINDKLWLDDKGIYGMYTYGRNYPVINPRAETLGLSLAILFDIAPDERAQKITASNPATPYGPAIFFPQISDMPPYHNNALWPFVASYWALANAKAGNEVGTLEAIGSVVRPAALFATNKENFNLDNGDIATELNSSNMLWSLSGNLALTMRVLFGMTFDTHGISFHPVIPKALSDTRSMDGFKYRDATLNITVNGYGNKIKSFRLNGKASAPFLPADFKGVANIVIEMADNEMPEIGINHTPNIKAPITPITRLLPGTAQNDDSPILNTLTWQPIEYIDKYLVLRDGNVIDTTYSTTYDANIPGEYQVIGVATDGTQSFASEPLSNRTTIAVEMPDESDVMTSSEVSYPPVRTITGYTGRGFRETDQNTSTISIPVNIPTAGTYSLQLVYANGNGPVNTENKCAIRSVSVDGNDRIVGTVVMPHRGVANWNDWGITNPVKLALPSGIHTIDIKYVLPFDRNMNDATNHALIDKMILTKLN